MVPPLSLAGAVVSRRLVAIVGARRLPARVLSLASERSWALQTLSARATRRSCYHSSTPAPKRPTLFRSSTKHRETSPHSLTAFSPLFLRSRARIDPPKTVQPM